jgi:hypothetical protein
MILLYPQSYAPFNAASAASGARSKILRSAFAGPVG